MKEVSEYFRKLRMDDNHHLGLGDVRISAAQQTEIVVLIEKQIPIDIIKKYIDWKKQNPNEDYQLDEIGEFYATLSRSDKLDIMECLLTIAA